MPVSLISVWNSKYEFEEKIDKEIKEFEGEDRRFDLVDIKFTTCIDNNEGSENALYSALIVYSPVNLR